LHDEGAKRRGIVYISPRFSFDGSHSAFIGAWEQDGPPQLLEERPGWDKSLRGCNRMIFRGLPEPF
jgi:hypothetical protein